MIFGRRQIALTTSYQPSATYEFGPDSPVWKLTVATSADILLQVSERYPPVFENAFDTEVELDKGTHSLAFVNEVHGIRFRAADLAAVISFRCYGPGIQ